jgi:hypothetical protein
MPQRSIESKPQVYINCRNRCPSIRSKRLLKGAIMQLHECAPFETSEDDWLGNETIPFIVNDTIGLISTVCVDVSAQTIPRSHALSLTDSQYGSRGVLEPWPHG